MSDKILWIYANRINDMPAGQAEHMEALVEIAEQLNRLNNTLEDISKSLKILARNVGAK